MSQYAQCLHAKQKHKILDYSSGKVKFIKMANHIVHMLTRGCYWMKQRPSTVCWPVMEKMFRGLLSLNKMCKTVATSCNLSFDLPILPSAWGFVLSESFYTSLITPSEYSSGSQLFEFYIMHDIGHLKEVPSHALTWDVIPNFLLGGCR